MTAKRTPATPWGRSASEYRACEPETVAMADALFAERQALADMNRAYPQIDSYYFGGANKSALILVDTMAERIYTLAELNALLRSLGEDA